MKVRELIEELQKLDPELEVVKQKDDEGNGYHLLYAVDDNCFVEDIGERYLEVWTAEDLADEDYNVEHFTQVCVVV